MSHWKDGLDPERAGGRYLAWKEVALATGLSRTTAWRLQKRGEFPAPYVISRGRVGYRESEVEAWKATRGHRGGASIPVSRAAEPSSAPQSTVGPSLRLAPRDGPEACPPRSRRRQTASCHSASQMTFDF